MYLGLWRTKCYTSFTIKTFTCKLFFVIQMEVRTRFGLDIRLVGVRTEDHTYVQGLAGRITEV